MDNVLIDDRRIHVDFSQSVAKIKWKGKGNRSEACVDFTFGMFEHQETCRISVNLLCVFKAILLTMWYINSRVLLSVLGGKYTKDDFKAYEKDVESRSKLTLKDQAKPRQEYPCAIIMLAMYYWIISPHSLLSWLCTSFFVFGSPFPLTSPKKVLSMTCWLRRSRRRRATGAQRGSTRRRNIIITLTMRTTGSPKNTRYLYCVF